MPFLRATREIVVPAPRAAGRGAVLDAIYEQLEREGNRVRMSGPDRISFDGPGILGHARFGASIGARMAAVVSGGMVVVERVTPDIRIRLDLRFSGVPFVIPLLMAIAAAAGMFPREQRLQIFALVLTILAFSCGGALLTYRGWVAGAARRAGVSRP